jgi:AraC-like DNA-binding protein
MMLHLAAVPFAELDDSGADRGFAPRAAKYGPPSPHAQYDPFRHVVLSPDEFAQLLHLGECSIRGLLTLTVQGGPPARATAIEDDLPLSPVGADCIALQLLTRLRGNAAVNPDSLLGDGMRPGADWYTPEPAADKNGQSVLPAWRLKKVIAYVEAHLPEKILLTDMAAVAGISRMHFASQFRHAVGCRPHDYVLLCRLERAQALLRRDNPSLVDVALDVGFQTQAHFSTVFKRIVGATPGKWRAANNRRGRATTVDF